MNLLNIRLFYDVLFSRFKWGSRHHNAALVVDVTNSMNEALLSLEQLPGHLPSVEFPTSTSNKRKS